MVIAFVGILYVINFVLVYPNPKLLFDATEGKSNTLSAETLQALKTLPGNVTAVAFYTTTNSSAADAKKLLENFKANSDGKFNYRFVNPDTDPVTARQAGITADGNIQLTLGDHKELVTSAAEANLTEGLIRLINPQTRVIYFLGGHGEPSTQAGADLSFATASQTLTNKNYTVNSLNLLTENKIPKDALAIIIAGPQKPLSADEVAMLKKYVDGGGSLVIMEDPVVVTQFGDAKDPLADYLVSDWGVSLDKDIVIDPSSQQPLYAYSSPSSSPHPIIQNLSANFTVIMPQARSISLASQPQNVTQTQLLLTGQSAWGEMNFTNAQGGQAAQVAMDPGVDIPGPVTMAVAAENSSTKGRVVVFGNSVFAGDKAFGALGNGSIFINAVDWAASQENLINITPRTPITRTFTPPSQGWFVLILLTSVCLFPGLILLMGISAWFARRRKG
jgi:ABC-type uncharacterized transport system involved in gliding motility auxiliary subunit